MDDGTGENSETAMGDEIDHLVAILVRRVKVWATDGGRRRRLLQAEELVARPEGESGTDRYLFEFTFTAEEHAVWLRAVGRLRREIDPQLTDEGCFEILLDEFLRRHRTEPRSMGRAEHGR